MNICQVWSIVTRVLDLVTNLEESVSFLSFITTWEILMTNGDLEAVAHADRMYLAEILGTVQPYTVSVTLWLTFH
jgi:hypothetical protein